MVYAPGGDDTAELLDGFAQSRLDAQLPKGAELQNVRNLGGEFTGMMAAVYKYIRAESRKVADGQRTSTVFEMAVSQLGLSKTSWTKKDLGVDIVVDGYINQAAMQAAMASMNFDLGRLIDVLLADGPYDFYWYDKTMGTSMSGPSFSASYSSGEWVLSLAGSVTFSFTVCQEFAAGTYATTGKVGTAVTNAVKNAAKIVSDNASLSDVNKLTAYKTAICNLTEYNHAAAGG